METGFSGLGKIPVVPDETEVDAREEIPDYRKHLWGKKELLVCRTSHESHSIVATLQYSVYHHLGSFIFK